jgi:outer membrane cobalamin receptor
MKIRIALLSILFISVALFSVISCATSGTARGSADLDTLLIENPDLTLKDYLRRLSGVMVTERGGEVRVMLRGTSSVTGDNSPLFVVDGTQVGTSYIDVENAVNIRDVDYIRIMRSSEAMTTYGMRASNGAIVIYTKN